MSGGRGKRSASEAVGEEDENGLLSKRSRRSSQEMDSNDPLALPRQLEEQGYFKGSIVHIRLKNFVTYSECEFFPGPNLNVVIGPNGAGKSTIVCALALGLWGKTELLGRGKKMNEFIKFGAKEAIVDIELFRGSNFPLLRVMLRIHRDNTTEYSLNGRRVEKKAVPKRLAEELNVQIDNLCHFLPQDKVCEFAALTHQQRLKETERAVGSRDLLARHEELETLSQEIRRLSVTANERNQHLMNLEGQNKLLERDVQRFRRREERLRQIEVMHKKRPWLLWNKERERAVSIRDSRNQVKQDIEKLKSEQTPLLQELEELDKRVNTLDAERRRAQERLRALDGERRKRGDELEQQEREQERLQDNLANLQNQANERKQRAEKVEKDIAAIQQKLQGSNLPAINQAIMEHQNEDRRLNREMGELNQRMAEIGEERRAIMNEIQQIDRRLQQMQDVRHQRLERIRNQNKHVYDAHVWLENNRDRFQKEAYGPLCLEVRANQPIYASYMEMACASWVALAFVFQTEDDRNLFEEEAGRRHWRLSTLLPTNLSWSNPADARSLAQFGIRTWLDKCIEAPDAIKASLCDNSGINRAAVADSDVSSTDVYNFTDGKVYDIFTPRTRMYSIRSKYGQRAISTSNYPIKPADRCWYFGVGVDMTQKTALENDRDALRRRSDEKERELRSLNQELLQLQAQKQLHQDKIKELNSQKREREALVRAVERKEKELAELSKEADFSVEERKIRTQIEKVLRTRIAKAKEMRALMEELTRLALDQDFAAIERQQLTSRQHAVQSQNLRMYSSRITELERDYNRFSQLFAEAEHEVKRLKLEANRIAPMDQWKNDPIFTELPNELAALDAKIAEYQAEVDFIAQSNPVVVREYEQRLVQIEELKASLQKEEEELNRKKSNMETKKTSWLKEVEGLVTEIDKSFRKHFSRFGVGSVALVKDDEEDFSKYSLEIRVAYRDGADPCPLDPNTQSGGERSVATMIFLLCLHHITQCPFRLVDEINQGMDVENERKVFEIMQQIACSKICPQYFLITPKLLPNLAIIEQKLSFLCIMNGPWADH